MKIQHTLSAANAAKVTAAIMLTRLAIRLLAFALIGGAIYWLNNQ